MPILVSIADLTITAGINISMPVLSKRLIDQKIYKCELVKSSILQVLQLKNTKISVFLAVFKNCEQYKNIKALATGQLLQNIISF